MGKMCLEEFIAYQCGHRSMGVLRVCPTTTTGHNFPVCSILPLKPFYAETMCTACERQLHSRWVLIREWEHRWLHERGACPCDVVFPGLLHVPRVIGESNNPDASGDLASTSDPLGLVDRDSTAEGAGGLQAEGTRGDDNTAGTSTAAHTSAATGDNVPALFTETETSSGEHHVAVRLPGLFAAEWKADHRKLHEAGKCKCAATFTDFEPEIRDGDLEVADQENLLRWRKLEAQQMSNNPEGSGMARLDDETLQRIAEIEKVFGKFTIAIEPPPVNAPRLVGPSGADNQVVETRGQGGGRSYNRRFEKGAGRQRQQGYNFQQQHGPAVSAHQPAPPFAGSYAYLPQYPYRFTAAHGDASAAFPYPQDHRAPRPLHFITPVNPSYATAATFTNTIPHGAYPWAAAPQPTPSMDGNIQGPGPYRTPGHQYHRSTLSPMTAPQQPQYQQQGYGQSPTPVQNQLPAQEQKTTDKGKGNEPEQPPDEPATLPICGLPIGAGPEGRSHMSSWFACRLRQSSTPGAVTVSEADADEMKEREDDDTKEDKEDKELEKEDDDDGKKMAPPSPPRRRHSAST